MIIALELPFDTSLGQCHIKRGGLNGSTQHSARTRLVLIPKAKSLGVGRSDGTRPWLGFDQVQANRPVLLWKDYRIRWRVLHRCVEPQKSYNQPPRNLSGVLIRVGAFKQLILASPKKRYRILQSRFPGFRAMRSALLDHHFDYRLWGIFADDSLQSCHILCSLTAYSGSEASLVPMPTYTLAGQSLVCSASFIAAKSAIKTGVLSNNSLPNVRGLCITV